MCALIGCQFAHNAKLVDEKNDQLFCCLSVPDFELKILFNGVHLSNSEKMFDRKVYILFIKKFKNKYMSPYYV